MSDEIINKKLSDISDNTRPNKTISKLAALTGTLTPLPSIDCVYVELYNNSNALIFTVDGGDSVTPSDPAAIPIYVDNASKITVKGSGNLGYLVHR